MKYLLLPLVIAALLVSAVSTANAEPVSQPDTAAIDSFIENEMKATNLPGLSLAIVHNKEIVYLKGYGIADEAGNPVTPETPFLLASLSKSFVALSIMQLVEAGKVKLDAPVQNYLPWFRVADEAASSRITVRQMLNHTSGIPGSAGMEFFTGNADKETQARSLANVELDRPVGVSYEYANPTFTVLALIVQQVSGQSFEQYVQEHIFTPLQMANSFTSTEDADKHGLATGHTYALGVPVPVHLPYNPGGVPYCCIISSAEDLSHYLIAQTNGGQYAGSSVLSAQGMNMMHAPAVQEDRPERYYGMAWETRPINGIPTVMHTGEGPGWQTNLIMLPNGWGIVVLMNGYNFIDSNFGADRLRGIARGVASLVVGQTPPPASSATGAYAFYSVLLVIVLVQALGMAYSVKLIRRWQRGENVPQGNWCKSLRIIPSLILNLLWAGLMFFLIPNILMPFSLMKVFIPVMAYALLASGLVALIWALLRTILTVQAFREKKSRVISSPVIPV